MPRILSLLKSPKFQEIAAILSLLLGSILFYASTYDRSSYVYILRADEGVSFATAMRVLQGFIPQRDFPSYYGPVMPYMYAGAFALFGASIAVMRAFWAFLYIISVLLFYKIGRKLLPASAAFIAAAMVIGQQHTPLYTYNHVGLVLAIQGILLLVLNALTESPVRYFRATLTALLLLALLVKFNEAVVVFGVLVIALWINRLNRPDAGAQAQPLAAVPLRDVLVPGALALLVFLAVTIVLNAGLSQSEFLRNFPMLPQYQASIGGYSYVKLVLSMPFQIPLLQITARTWYFFWYENYVFAILVSFLIGVLVLVAALRFFASPEYRRKLDLPRWKSILVLAVAVGTYHEFYLTGNHWSTPMYVGFSLLALTCLIWHGLAGLPRIRNGVLAGVLLLCVISDVYYAIWVHRNYSDFYLDVPRARIYSSADGDAPVVREVVEFLDQVPQAGQSIAAFPHDALLIYLAGRRNALRDDDYQWMLFPTQASDDEVVHELETRKVSQVLLSNFVGIRHGVPVFFGQDYLPHTFRYLQDHYRVVKTFGADPRGYQVQYLEFYDFRKEPPSQ